MKDACTSKCRPVIVFGAERSGTSVVAEMVRRWGAYAGEPDKLRKGDEHNPQGYSEYTPIWDFLVELGDFAEGASWWDASFQEGVKEKAGIPQYREKAQSLIGTMKKQGRPWVWKDPALSFFLPFWREIWRDPVYIIPVRNPYDIAVSWQKFVLPPEQEGSLNLIAGNLLRWQYMMLLVLEHTDDAEDKLFIPFEGLMRDPKTHAKGLSEFLDRSCADKTSDEMRIEQMARVVNPRLWRNRANIPFSRVHEATNEQKALYQFLGKKTEDPLTKLNITDYPMPADWRDVIKDDEARRRTRLQHETG
jgi:hypothetical protein